MLLYTIFFLLTGLAIAALLWAIALPRMTVGASVRRLDDYGYGTIAGRAAPTTSADASLAHRFLQRISPSGYEARVRQQFVRAGIFNATPESILLFRYGLPVVTAIAGAAVLAQSHTLLDVALVAISIVVAFRLPEFVLNRRIRHRAAIFDHDVPDFIELIAITVEAGLGFEAATQAAIGRMAGPLREEFSLMLQEIRMGVARNEAVQHVVDRVDSRNLKVFAQSLVQGQTLGVPLAQILKNLAIDMRLRRRQAAEERAQKAPVKIVLVAFFLILPSLLLIVLGPAAFRIYDELLNNALK
jgi:tight adherence protein C